MERLTWEQIRMEPDADGINQALEQLSNNTRDQLPEGAYFILILANPDDNRVLPILFCPREDVWGILRATNRNVERTLTTEHQPKQEESPKGRLTWDQIKNDGPGISNARELDGEAAKFTAEIRRRLPLGCDFFICIVNDILEDATLLTGKDMTGQRLKILAESILESFKR